jgi:hypothetical protein
MKSMLFHRLALSKDKKGVLELSEQGQEIQKADDTNSICQTKNSLKTN